MSEWITMQDVLAREEKEQARVAELEAELDVYDERENGYVARIDGLEAEAERLRVRLRTVVTEWQLRCAALANGEKP
jgi:hypothetical protein